MIVEQLYVCVFLTSFVNACAFLHTNRHDCTTNDLFQCPVGWILNHAYIDWAGTCTTLMHVATYLPTYFQLSADIVLACIYNYFAGICCPGCACTLNFADITVCMVYRIMNTSLAASAKGVFNITSSVFIIYTVSTLLIVDCIRVKIVI